MCGGITSSEVVEALRTESGRMSKGDPNRGKIKWDGVWTRCGRRYLHESRPAYILYEQGAGSPLNRGE